MRRPDSRRRSGKEEVDVSDTSVPHDALRVTTCDTDQTLAAASGLFNQYRRSYGEPPDEDERTLGWLTDMVETNMLAVYTASLGSSAGTPPIGLATCHAVWLERASGLARESVDEVALYANHRATRLIATGTPAMANRCAGSPGLAENRSRTSHWSPFATTPPPRSAPSVSPRAVKARNRAPSSTVAEAVVVVVSSLMRFPRRLVRPLATVHEASD
jgi:hypothetical protein